MIVRFVFVLTLLVAFPSCIDFDELPDGGLPPIDFPDPDPPPPDGDGNLTIALSVSNPTPQVNEQVRLSCDVITGDVEGIIFDFEPGGARLAVDSASGLGMFIVQETDVGQAISFTCFAENALGDTTASNAITITPTQ